MDAASFCYWLQGYLELQPNKKPKPMTEKQLRIVQNHLNLVFLHDLDPKANAESPIEPGFAQQVHDGKTTAGTPFPHHGSTSGQGYNHSVVLRC